MGKGRTNTQFSPKTSWYYDCTGLYLERSNREPPFSISTRSPRDCSKCNPSQPLVQSTEMVARNGRSCESCRKNCVGKCLFCGCEDEQNLFIGVYTKFSEREVCYYNPGGR